MTFIANVPGMISQWVNGMDLTDHMLMLAIGLSLIILSVVVLLAHRHLEKRRNAPRRSVPFRPINVPGQRHVATRYRKKDAFNARLDSLS